MTEETIIHAMARALFVQAYADAEEEAGRTIHQADWMYVAPPTPRYAIDQAYRLVGMIEMLNRPDDVHNNLICLFAVACRADGEDFAEVSDWYAEEFGHYLAMESLGHGVSWFDDHARFDIKLPYFQFELQDEVKPTYDDLLQALRRIEACITFGSIDDQAMREIALKDLLKYISQ